MKCICKYCGHRHDSSRLVFNFFPLLKAAGEGMKQNLRTKFENICNTLDEMSEGPAFFTEGELALNPNVSLTRSDFVNKVMEALGQIDGFRDRFDGGKDITGAEIKEYVAGKMNMLKRTTSREPLIKLCEKLSQSSNVDNTANWFAEVCNNKLELPDMIFEMKVKTLKGEGDIKISKVLDGANGVIAGTRHCPYCNQEMSALSGAYPEIVLTVLGSPRASKSTTLTACVYQFVRDASPGSLPIHWAFHKDDKDWGRFEDQCLNRYTNNEKINATANGPDTGIPRFSVAVTVRDLPGGTLKVILTVVDLPGELMGKEGLKESLLIKYGDFYRNVDVIWYCTDWVEVKQITSDAERVKMGYKDDKFISIDDMCRTMSDLSNIFGEREIPVAFIMGKSDFLKESYGEEYQVCRGDWHGDVNSETGYYTKNGAELVLNGKKMFYYMEGVRSVLLKTAERLDEHIREKFPSHAYLAMSGYGHGFAKDDDGDPVMPLEPWNTEMPFLWTMAMLGYLRVQEVTVRKRLIRRDEISVNYYKATEDRITRRNLGMKGTGRNPAYQEHYL